VTEPSTAAQPMLRIVTANTTPEEIAALVAVLSSLGSPAAPPPPPRSAWADPATKMRGDVRARSWRASALPR
jgi:hypothetical protein